MVVTLFSAFVSPHTRYLVSARRMVTDRTALGKTPRAHISTKSNDARPEYHAACIDLYIGQTHSERT